MTTVAGISPRTFSPALIDFDIFAVFAVLTPIFTNLMPLATSPIRGIADTIDKPASVQLPLAADIAALSKSGIAPIPGKKPATDHPNCKPSRIESASGISISLTDMSQVSNVSTGVLFMFALPVST